MRNLLLSMTICHLAVCGFLTDDESLNKADDEEGNNEEESSGGPL